MADMRNCIGSAKFGIEAHEAPPDEFPAKPSQKDGLGRMCKPHWTEYTAALRKAALARAGVGGAPTVPSPAAARVATKHAARVAVTTPVRRGAAVADRDRPRVRAKRLIDAIDRLPGPEHVVAIATDEAQAALESLGAETAHEAAAIA